MEQLLSRMNHLVGIKDPEEVIQKVEMPSDDWIKIADFFIKNEFPEFEIPTKQPLPDKGRQDQKNSLLYEVKHRALGKYIFHLIFRSASSTVLQSGYRPKFTTKNSLESYAFNHL